MQGLPQQVGGKRQPGAVTRDRVPEHKEIILWTHADKTRRTLPVLFQKAPSSRR